MMTMKSFPTIIVYDQTVIDWITAFENTDGEYPSMTPFAQYNVMCSLRDARAEVERLRHELQLLADWADTIEGLDGLAQSIRAALAPAPDAGAD